MTKHLPECRLTAPCGADTPEHGYCSRQQTWCIHCERECMCKWLRRCENRVIDAAVQRLENYLQHDVADGWMPRQKAEGIIAVVKKVKND